MKRRCDFSKGKRGRFLPAAPKSRAKTRITIRIDADLLDYFLGQADASGGASGYQTLINHALRQCVDGAAPHLEETLRKIVREQLRPAG